VRSGLKSLLRSRSMFAMGEVSEAREQAEVAMEVYSDLIRTEREDRERMRLGPDDIVRLPTFFAINSWVANGSRQTAFVAETVKMGGEHLERLREHHLVRQRAAGASWPAALPPPIEIPPAGERVRRARVGSEEDDLDPVTDDGEGRRNDRLAVEPAGPPPLGDDTEDAGPAVADAEVKQPELFDSEPPTYAAVHRPGILGLIWDESESSAAVEKTFQPQARDLEVLRALWRYEVLLLSQIWREWWPDRTQRATQMRLKRLIGMGWLQRMRMRVSKGKHEAAYVLTREGLLAGQRHYGSAGPYVPEEAKWRPRRIVDHRSIQHTLQVNGWVLAYKRLAGEYVADWHGEHEGRLEVPTKVVERRRVPIGPDDVPRENYERVRDLRAGEFGRIWPDATLEMDLPDQGRRFDLMIELDRTEKPTKNFDKFERYDALITAWWRKVPRYRKVGEPPGVIFVCTDEDHVSSFVQAADRCVAGRLAQPGVVEASWPYPGRERILFVAERDIHDGIGRAWKLSAGPRTAKRRTGARLVQLPCLTRSPASSIAATCS
jgi:hypothetical protein